MEVKTVGVACDHAGFALKKFVLQYLEEKGYPYKDYGTWSDASVDYPDFGHALAEGIESGEVYPGIAICGSGEGISITLNKHQQVRAGLCWIPEIAHLIRQHNDANVLVMPGRLVASSTTIWPVRLWTSSLLPPLKAAAIRREWTRSPFSLNKRINPQRIRWGLIL